MNDAQRFERALALFGELCDLPLADREPRLVEFCGEDAALRAQVEALLSQDDRSADTIDAAAAGGAMQALAETVHADPSWPPAKLGGYRIVGELGVGGMGAVFEAEQDNPKRRVALKVIRRGFASAELKRRFQREAYVLGQLRHPGIAQIYEAGADEAGGVSLPFFAMELVEGMPLDHAMAECAPKQRLELLARVCDAVWHAHQKGVIHRDLKPGNVLVVTTPADTTHDRPRPSTSTSRSGVTTLHDPIGQPKVLDFGIARLTDADVQATTIQTQAGQIVGTLGYMSPEQLAGDVDRIDTRCDVYALGVLLYQALAGRMPHEVRDLPIAQAANVILEEEPALLGRLDSAYRGDVETIVAKAMEKTVDRRYSSVADLAADLRRHLNHEPILARPATTIYQLRKFANRHRGLVFGLTATFVTLIVGLASTFYYLLEANRQTAEAIAARDEAARVSRFQSAQLQSLDVSLMGVRLRQALIAATPEKRQAELTQQLAGVNFTDLARETLEQNLFGGTREAIHQEFPEASLVRAELLQALANTLMPLGLTELAVDPQAEAIAIRAAALGAEHPDTLLAKAAQGRLHVLRGDFKSADPILRAVFEEQRERLGDRHRDTLATVQILGTTAKLRGDYPDAEQWFRKAYDGRRAALGEAHPDTLVSWADLGLALYRQGDYPAAESEYVAVLAKQREILGDAHASTIETLSYLAALRLAQGQSAKAESLFREVLEQRRILFGEDHVSTLMTYGHIGMALRNLGREAEAEPFYRQAADGCRRVLGDGHSETLTSLNNLGTVLNALERHDEAEECFREAVAGQRRAFGSDHPETLLAIGNLGLVFYNRGKFAEAEPLFRESLDGLVAIHGRKHPSVLGSMHNLGLFLLRVNKLDDAEALVREAIKGRVETLGPEHESTLQTIKGLGEVFEAQGKIELAIAQYQQALTGLRKSLGDAHPDTYYTSLWVANAQRKIQQWDAVTETRRLSVELVRQVKSLAGPMVAQSLELLGSHLLAHARRVAGEDSTKAASLRQEALPVLTEALQLRRAVAGDEPDVSIWRGQSLLGEALSHVEGKRPEAERMLLASAGALRASPSDGTARLAKVTRQRLVALYEAWHQHEPEAGYDQRAASWRDARPADASDSGK